MHQLFKRNNDWLFENNTDQQGEWIVFEKRGLKLTNHEFPAPCYYYDFSSEIFLRTVLTLIEQGWKLKHIDLDKRCSTLLDENYLTQRLVELADYHSYNMQTVRITGLIKLFGRTMVAASFKRPNVKIRTNGYVQFDNRNDLKPLMPIVNHFNDQIKKPYHADSSACVSDPIWAMLTFLLMRVYHWKLKDIKFDFFHDQLDQCYLIQKLIELAASKKLNQAAVFTLDDTFFNDVARVTLTTSQQHNIVVQQYGGKVSGGNSKEVKLVSKLTKELEQHDGRISEKYL